MDHMLRVSDQEALIAWFNHAQSLLGSRRGHQFDEIWLKFIPVFHSGLVDLWYYASKNKNNKSTVVRCRTCGEMVVMMYDQFVPAGKNKRYLDEFMA